MRKRTEVIREWIDARKERGEITKCMLYITVPKDTDIYKDETIKKICGAWNLNRDWVETGVIDCIVEFCGVYPIDWDLEDVAEFERMETDGEIIVLVDWIEDGKHIPNH